mmetsp:Transcript_42158/g.126089  ORF Transcript_42158/g.126089 Transcript_42158/m.126089 type:complete len:430 (-) Transcript_42158:194-1483(-)
MESYGGAHELDPAIFAGGGVGETEGWSCSPGDFSDYYREPDDVVRGVAMAQDVPDAFGSSCFQGFADGDFYRESDDIYKGLSVGAVPEAQLFDGPPAPDGLRKIGPGFGCMEVISQFCGNIEPFTEADVPLPAPSGPFANLESTTLYLSTSRPCDIGNALLNVLHGHVVTKVSRKKFAIKADAFVGNAMCSLKIRVYKQELDRYAVEFQQRSGDRFAYGQVYHEVSESLEKRFAADVPTNSGKEFGAMPPPPPPVSDADAVWAQAGPLLDLVGDTGRADLQAEAAAALAEMAQDSQAAATLCTSTAFKEFKALVRSDKPEVAYPAARLLSSMALCREAAQCFADESLLLAIIDKAHSDMHSSLVQKQFAQVLLAAMPRCALALSQQAATNVNAALVKAMTSTAVVDNSTRRILQEVVLLLQCQCPGVFT